MIHFLTNQMQIKLNSIKKNRNSILQDPRQYGALTLLGCAAEQQPARPTDNCELRQAHRRRAQRKLSYLILRCGTIWVYSVVHYVA